MMTNCNKGTQHVAGRRLPCASLLLTAPALLAFFAPGIGRLCEYRRTAGVTEAWRFLTCHWVHWNVDHLFWSAGAFLVLSVACEQSSRLRYLVCVFVSALVIPVGLWHGAPELAVYGGLSGIDSALFGLLAVSTVYDSIAARRWGGAIATGLFAGGFAAKVSFEMLTDSAVFVDASGGMVPVPLAHIVGVSVGAAIGLSQPLRHLIHSRWKAGRQCKRRCDLGWAEGRTP